MIRRYFIGLIYLALFVQLIAIFIPDKKTKEIPRKMAIKDDRNVLGNNTESLSNELVNSIARKRIDENSTNEYSFHINSEWRENFPLKKEISKKHTHKSIFTLGITHPDNEMYANRSRRHHMLKNFYENPRRYSEGFEKIYKIFEKYNVPHHTYLQACLFNELCHYKMYMANAGRELKEEGYRYEAAKDKDGKVVSIRREYGKIKGKDMADSRRRYMLNLLINEDIFIYEGESKVSEDTAALMVQEILEIEYKSFGKGLFWYDYGNRIRDGEYYIVN